MKAIGSLHSCWQKLLKPRGEADFLRSSHCFPKNRRYSRWACTAQIKPTISQMYNKLQICRNEIWRDGEVNRIKLCAPLASVLNILSPSLFILDLYHFNRSRARWLARQAWLVFEKILCWEHNRKLSQDYGRFNN